MIRKFFSSPRGPLIRLKESALFSCSDLRKKKKACFQALRLWTCVFFFRQVHPPSKEEGAAPAAFSRLNKGGGKFLFFSSSKLRPPEEGVLKSDWNRTLLKGLFRVRQALFTAGGDHQSLFGTCMGGLFFHFFFPAALLALGGIRCSARAAGELRPSLSLAFCSWGCFRSR